MAKRIPEPDRGELAYLGDQVRKHRLARGKRLRQLASDVGVSVQQMSNIELGNFRPSCSVYAALCRVFGYGAPPMFPKTK